MWIFMCTFCVKRTLTKTFENLIMDLNWTFVLYAAEIFIVQIYVNISNRKQL